MKQISKINSNVASTLLTYKEPFKIIFVATLWAVSLSMALLLRFDFDPEHALSMHYLALPLAVLIPLRAIAYNYWKLNQGYWRYCSTYDLSRIIIAHLTSSITFAALILLLRIEGFPRSVIFMELCLSILLAGGSRLVVRSYCENFLNKTASKLGHYPRDVIILGAGDSGHLLAKTLISHNRFGYRPIAVLDDNENIIGGHVHGIKITGALSSLEKFLSEGSNVQAVISAIPSLSQVRANEITDLCHKFNVTFKRLQSFEDIACLDAGGDIQTLSIESVLEKQMVFEHDHQIRNKLEGRCVLVTGAGGSIGSELVKQLLSFGPARLIAIDNCEYNLFKAEMSFGNLAPKTKIFFKLSDIRNIPRMERVFDDHRPDIVFHAAAYKHVPIIETNSYDAFQNNVVGTLGILECCRKFDVRRFVLISTDKAVQPSSIMGCSKRLAEAVVREFNGLGNQGGPETSVVRFGNVINSTGSVIPLFKEQIARGGPLTVTHPEVERFFMSIPEAVRLVLTAGTLGGSGEVFVLDMGKKLKVIEVAKKMLMLYGRKDIPIVITGLRPGEKLTEELVTSSEVLTPTNFEKVRKIASNGSAKALILPAILEMKDAASKLSNEAIGAWMRNTVNQLETNSPHTGDTLKDVVHG